LIVENNVSYKILPLMCEKYDSITKVMQGGRFESSIALVQGGGEVVAAATKPPYYFSFVTRVIFLKR
jgi:hypothetical protein